MRAFLNHSCRKLRPKAENIRNNLPIAMFAPPTRSFVGQWSPHPHSITDAATPAPIRADPELQESSYALHAPQHRPVRDASGSSLHASVPTSRRRTELTG